jgi:methylated-DNA-[protein]-cysteine S-methyltransferase
MEALGFCLFGTAIGACGIAWGGQVIVAVQLPETSDERTRARMLRAAEGAEEAEPPAWVADVIRRVRALLQGERDDLLDVPLALVRVPEFNRRVYEVARAIPPGRVLTYGEVARRIGEPGASRAVGAALGANPFAPVVPCHRVLAAGGRSGGFSAEGGANTKLRMLEIERAQFGETPGLFD